MVIRWPNFTEGHDGSTAHRRASGEAERFLDKFSSFFVFRKSLKKNMFENVWGFGPYFQTL